MSKKEGLLLRTSCNPITSAVAGISLKVDLKKGHKKEIVPSHKQDCPPEVTLKFWRKSFAASVSILACIRSGSKWWESGCVSNDGLCEGVPSGECHKSTREKFQIELVNSN